MTVILLITLIVYTPGTTGSLGRHLTSWEFRGAFPCGWRRDKKVMGYRVDRELRLTIALVLVDRFVSDCQRYFEHKHEIETALSGYLVSRQRMADRITIEINTLESLPKAA